MKYSERQGTGCGLHRLAAILLLACMLVMSLAGCQSSGSPGSEGGQTAQSVVQEAGTGTDGTGDSSGQTGTEPDGTQISQDQGEAADAAIPADGSYTTKEDVSLYLHTYGGLPDNFITKKEAQKLGWSGGSLEPYAPGKCIGGDRFGNYEGLLPEGISYHECDIDTLGAEKRGARRIIYGEDGSIYYTDDHYESFTQLY